MVATWRNLSPKENVVVATTINGVGPHKPYGHINGLVIKTLILTFNYVYNIILSPKRYECEPMF